MRTTSFGLGLVLVAMVGCGGGMTGDDTSGDDTPPGDDGVDPPAEGFQLVSPDITLAPGEEITKCWYFQTPNSAEKAVTKWSSVMTPGSHHMIVFFTDGMQQAPGTIVDNCGFTGSAGSAVWTYSAQMPESSQQLPAGVGMPIAAGQYGFIQMHYLNSTDADLTVHVTLNVDTYADGTAFIPAAPFITFQASISIPPGEDATFGGSCDVPADKDFYQLGTHAHKRATHMEVKDGAAMVFQTDSWSEPGGEEWLSAPFYRFTSGKLNYSCDFHNDTPNVVETGDSAATDEMCMAVGYMFPATEPTLCVNSFIISGGS